MYEGAFQREERDDGSLDGLRGTQHQFLHPLLEVLLEVSVHTPRRDGALLPRGGKGVLV